MGNWLDIVIVATTLIVVYLGARMGLARAMATALGAGAAAILLSQEQTEIALALSGPVSSSLAGELFGLLALPFAVFVGAVVLGFTLRGMLRFLFLGSLDRALGSALGLVLAVVMWLFLVEEMAPVAGAGVEEAVAESYLAHYIIGNGAPIMSMLSKIVEDSPASALVIRVISSIS